MSEIGNWKVCDRPGKLVKAVPGNGTHVGVNERHAKSSIEIKRRTCSLFGNPAMFSNQVTTAATFLTLESLKPRRRSGRYRASPSRGIVRKQICRDEDKNGEAVNVGPSEGPVLAEDNDNLTSVRSGEYGKQQA